MKDGWTALMYACFNGFSEIIHLLVKHGANINVTDRNHMSCIHWAARFNNVKVAKILLELGIKYTESDIDGLIPSSLARKNQNLDLEKIIKNFDKNKKEKAITKRRIKEEKNKVEQEKKVKDKE